MTKAKCTKCGARILVEPGATSLVCPGCGRSFRLKNPVSKSEMPSAVSSRLPIRPPQSPPARTPPSPQVAEWHYADENDQQQGPVRLDVLNQLLGSGVVSESTLVWKNGMTDWTPANQVKILFPSASALDVSTPIELTNNNDPSKTTSQEVGRRIFPLVFSSIGFLLFFTPQFLVVLKLPFESKKIVMAFGWDTWWGKLGFIILTFISAMAVLDFAVGSKINNIRRIFKSFYVPAHGIVALATIVGILLGIFAIGLKGLEYEQNITIADAWSEFELFKEMQSDRFDFKEKLRSDFEEMSKNASFDEIKELRSDFDEEIAEFDAEAKKESAYIYFIPFTGIIIVVSCAMALMVGRRAMLENA